MSRRGRLVGRFIDDVASDYGEDDLGVVDGVGLDFEDVAIEHDEVGGLADFERPFIFFKTAGKGSVARVTLDGMSDG